MLVTILGVLGNLPFIGTAIRSFSKGVVDYHRVTVEGANQKEKIEADLTSRKLELDQKEAAINAATVRAEQGNWFTRWVRPAWAFPFVAFAWKKVLWDHVIMADWINGTTKPLEADMSTAMSLIILAYFGARGAQYLIKEFRK